MPDFFDERRPHNALSYDEYRADWQEQKEASLDDLSPEERKMHHYLNYNWERQAHVHAAYTPSADLRAAVESIDAPQLWMVLTEPWCGDSAFLLPVVAEAAALNDQVTLRILHRDDHLDIMDQYLTGGSRSIPKLVAFDADGTEQFTWGPRPETARDRFEALRTEHDDKMAAIEGLIEHYEDGGWQEADPELADALQALQPTDAA
ncbi:MAG: thioredoxin family protein [Salinivenus sp.]